MRWMCHYVPVALSAGLFLSACYADHGDECDERLPTAQVCCDGAGNSVPPASMCPFVCGRGTAVASADECAVGTPPPPVVDAGPGTPDAAPPPSDASPPPLECPLARAAATCLESFLVEPGVPFALPVTFDACTCCADTQCAAETDAASQTLYLTTALCPDPCDCDSCNTPQGRCDVPPLAEGTWNVVVNDAPAFQLPVYPDSGLVAPPPGCATYAEPDACAFSERIDPTGWRPTQVCAEQHPWLGTPSEVTLTLASDCWTCGQLLGPCQVTLEERHTFDLPPGGELRVSPQYHWTACDVDCPAVCIEAEQRCVAPPLNPGEFYRVWADGEVMLSFVAGEADGICSVRTP
ncbi:MAG: hypothetical protein JRH11_08070 [Deltaproteobacteria bacterium]|nr:hypothetical protein [Deltaproteobacteria bacterium]